MGHVCKRGGACWIRYYRNGQRIEESAQAGKYDDARDLLKIGFPGRIPMTSGALRSAT